MKPFLKKSMLVFLLLVIIGVIFIYWTSSASLSEKDRAKITKNEYPEDKANDSVFSLMTYNIGHLSGLYEDTSLKDNGFYDANLKRASQLIQSVKPDIICFQDIDYNSKRSFNVNQSLAISKLGYSYAADAVYWDKKHILSPYWPISKQTGQVISGLSTLSKFSIKDQDRIVLKEKLNLPFYKKMYWQERIAQVLTLDLYGTEVILINVHLEDLSKDSREPQFNFILNLFEEYSKTHPTIILGDFNSSINKDDSLIHQFFKMPDVGHANFKNLDYIFFNKNAIAVIDSKVLTEFEEVANHIPVYMEFKLIHK